MYVPHTKLAVFLNLIRYHNPIAPTTLPFFYHCFRKMLQFAKLLKGSRILVLGSILSNSPGFCGNFNSKAWSFDNENGGFLVRIWWNKALPSELRLRIGYYSYGQPSKLPDIG